jgi:hypothetical protein
VLDVDGDGKSDVGVWRRSTGEWLVLKSTNGFNVDQPFTYGPWGITGDVPLPKAARPN